MPFPNEGGYPPKNFVNTKPLIDGLSTDPLPLIFEVKSKGL